MIMFKILNKLKHLLLNSFITRIIFICIIIGWYILGFIIHSMHNLPITWFFYLSWLPTLCFTFLLFCVFIEILAALIRFITYGTFLYK